MLASQGAQPAEQFKLRDFPPSPFDAKFTATTSLETDPALRRVDRDVDFNAVITNQAAMALIADIKELKAKLLSLKSAVHAKDPMLRVYAQYVDTAHDWVMKAHGREFTAANQYFSSYATNQTTQLVRDRAIRLIDMALYTDLARNTNFAPLLKSTFETLSRKSPKLRSSYARNDALIGFQRTAPPKPVTTWEAYVVELDQRYGLVLIKLEQIQSREAIPAEVITGSMYGDIYRTLDDSAQQYVMLNTPEEIQKLQQELIRKAIELSRLQAPPR